MYIDESGFAVDAPRIRGYSIKGDRCYGVRDWHSKGRVNAIGALIGLKLLTVCLFDSYIDSDVFYSWIKNDLVGKLPKNAVIVMDNATFHKRADVTLLLEQNKHTVLFLPSYSPDLNPIEKKWAQAKAIRRKLRCNPNDLFLYHNL